MKLPENVVKRGDTFQFRIDIPADCRGRPPFGRGKEWKQSLKTRDPRQLAERAARMRVRFADMCRQARAEGDPAVIAAKRSAQWLLSELAPSVLLPDQVSRDAFAEAAEAKLARLREKLAADDWQVLLYRQPYSEEHQDVKFEDLPIPLAFGEEMLATLRRSLDMQARELEPLRTGVAARQDANGSDENTTLAAVLEKAAREKGTGSSTLANYRSAIKRLEAMHGPKRLREWTKADFVSFKERALENRKAHGTVSKDLSAFRLVFGYAHKNGLRPDNPAAAISRPGRVAKLERVDFSNDQLKALLGNVTKDTDEWWLLRLALTTGMREGEAAQLRHTDVRKIGDIWVVDINDTQDEYGHKSLKRGSTARVIPVPQVLLDDGFVKFAHRHAGRIFSAFKDSEGKRAAQRVSNWFTKYRRSLEIEPGNGQLLDFHSLRHTFKTKARKGMPEEWSDAITGHTNGRLIGRDYGGYDLQTMKSHLDAMRWPLQE